MCTLLVWKHRHPRYPLVAAAVRDEFLDRPSTGPQILARAPTIVGGKDLIGGGTWYALCDARRIFTVTNRRDAGAHDPAKRSRGAMVLEIARSTSLREARERAGALDAAAYNPFILFAGDIDEAFVAHGGVDGLQIVDVADGAHAVTNWDIDAVHPAKAARARQLATSFVLDADAEAPRLVPAIAALLAYHGSPDGGDAVCVHRPERRYGSRSATIALLGARAAHTRLYDAEGPPCSTPFVEMAAGVREESDLPS